MVLATAKERVFHPSIRASLSKDRSLASPHYSSAFPIANIHLDTVKLVPLPVPANPQEYSLYPAEAGVVCRLLRELRIGNPAIMIEPIPQLL